MRKVYSLVLFVLFISCANKFEKVEELISKEEYVTAKKTIKEVKLEAGDADLYNNFIRVIDSGLYAKANEAYLQEKGVEAKKLLSHIDYLSEFKSKKYVLLNHIQALSDSSNFSLANNYFKDKNYEDAINALSRLSDGSVFHDEEIKLRERINTELNLQKIALAKNEKVLAKCVISSVFGRPISSMTVITLKDSKGAPTGIYEVTYSSDGRKYINEVKFEGKSAVWRAKNGRWRTEDNLSYEETSNAYYVIEVYSDGSKRKDEFPK